MKVLKRYLLLLLACLCLAGCGQSELEPVEPTEPEQPVQETVQQEPEQPAQETVQQEQEQQETAAVEQPAVQEQAPTPEPVVEKPALPVYDFSLPAPETPAVDNTYFQDAAFVGDSRTDGFMIYSGIGCGKNLTSNGLSIFKLAEKKALTIGGEKYTLLEALEMERYGKVYLCLGVNELGIYDDEGFYQSYLNAIDSIRTIQPQAVIYIQGLIPLNEEDVAASGGRDYLKNDHLRIYNDLMRKAAQEKQVVFLDLYTAFADKNGALPSGASRDGVHLKKEYCQKWLSYLQTHTVAPELVGLTETEIKEETSL